MPIPPPIDPRQLAAEIEACVAEFNRLVALASSMGVAVEAELRMEPMIDAPGRPILAVRVISTL